MKILIEFPKIVGLKGFKNHSGVSRRLRRLASIETAFGHQNGPTRPDPTTTSNQTPHSWALNSKKGNFLFRVLCIPGSSNLQM